MTSHRAIPSARATHPPRHLGYGRHPRLEHLGFYLAFIAIRSLVGTLALIGLARVESSQEFDPVVVWLVRHDLFDPAVIGSYAVRSGVLVLMALWSGGLDQLRREQYEWAALRTRQ